MLNKARAATNGGERDWDPAIAIPTLIGSLLSLFATTAVIICWTFAGQNRKRREFRYALILNLTVAEFINTLNNSVSGIIVVSKQDLLDEGTACTVNGWVGQFSIQAVDFSILAISVVTLLTIQLKSYIIYASVLKKAMICISIWITPLITSIIALKLDLYRPVSGNWCWIGSGHDRLRYALTHGWRFGIILVSFSIYIFVFIYMNKRLKGRSFSDFTFNYSSDDDSTDLEMENRGTSYKGNLDGINSPTSVTQEEDGKPNVLRKHRRGTSSFSFSAPTRIHQHPIYYHNIDSAFSEKELLPASPMPRSHASKRTIPSPLRLKRIATDVDRDVWHMVLLNLYPITYLLLWLPGIINRLAEANGHSVRALAIMQCSTQFIGLANAAVYFYREHLNDVRDWYRRRSGRRY